MGGPFVSPKFALPEGKTTFARRCSGIVMQGRSSSGYHVSCLQNFAGTFKFRVALNSTPYMLHRCSILFVLQKVCEECLDYTLKAGHIPQY